MKIIKALCVAIPLSIIAIFVIFHDSLTADTDDDIDLENCDD